MISEINSDIFLAPIDVIIHQTNLETTWGAGLALEMKRRFPKAYQADLNANASMSNKLGLYSVAAVDHSRIKFIVNLYSQTHISSSERTTSYDAMVSALTKLRESILEKNKQDLVLGVPYKLGCGLAGGDFRIVDAILHSVFEESPIKVLICKFP